MKQQKRIDNIGKATGFFLFRNLVNSYNEIKNDETKRMKTVMAKYKVKTRDCQLIVGVRLSLKEKINVTQLDFFSCENTYNCVELFVLNINLHSILYLLFILKLLIPLYKTMVTQRSHGDNFVKAAY